MSKGWGKPHQGLARLSNKWGGGGPLTGLSRLSTAGGSVGPARYWRVLQDAEVGSGLWDCISNGAQGAWATADATGTNLGADLVPSTTLSFRDSTEAEAGSMSGTPAGHIFSGTGRWLMDTTSNPPVYIWMDFGVRVTLRSLALRANLASRFPTQMLLQRSADNALWQTVATLTQAATGNSKLWENIANGATIAAVES